MGELSHLPCLTKDVMGGEGIVSAALHAMLSSNEIFKVECTTFTHKISNTNGDSYLALYLLMYMVHPVLEQAAVQPHQPLQLKTQSFSEHIPNYLNYFQSEE
jgi:hypothetical protein